MPAARHQIGEADLIDLRQVRVLDPFAVRRFDYLLDIDFAPAEIGKRDLGVVPVGADANAVVDRPATTFRRRV